jgi:uncharacterized protein YyaL (SSP411 family)
MQRDGLLLRTYKDGEAKLNGYLEDYASLIEGLISLYEGTGTLKWIENAIRLTDKMIEEFWDEEEGGFFFTGKSHEQLIVRAKDFMDNATPSGNSLAAFALQKLAVLTGNETYQRHATTILRLLRDQIRRYPSAYSWALCATDFYLSNPKEVAIVGEQGDANFAGFTRSFWEKYLPNRVLALGRADHEAAERLTPLLANRRTTGGSRAYVCEAYTCQKPAETPSELADQLAIR